MTTKTQTTNEHAAADNIAESTPQRWQVPDAVASRIIAKAEVVDKAIAARDELIDLARDLLEVPNSAQLRPMPNGKLAFIEQQK